MPEFITRSDAESVRPQPILSNGAEERNEDAKRRRKQEEVKSEEEEKQDEGKENEEDDDMLDEGDVAREPRLLKNPFKPSEDEVERHRRTHIPYRSWCDICAQASVKEEPHHARKCKD